jgi:hypothetical protein
MGASSNSQTTVSYSAYHWSSPVQVLHISNLFTLAFSLGCAFAPNTGALIGFRFLCECSPSTSKSLPQLALAGFTGSAPIACDGGSVGDLFAAQDRASAMALFSLGPLIGT